RPLMMILRTKSRSEKMPARAPFESSTKTAPTFLFAITSRAASRVASGLTLTISLPLPFRMSFTFAIRYLPWLSLYGNNIIRFPASDDSIKLISGGRHGQRVRRQGEHRYPREAGVGLEGADGSPAHQALPV